MMEPPKRSWNATNAQGYSRCSFATQGHAQETPAGALVILRTVVVIFMAARAQVRERMKGGGEVV